MPDRAHLTAGYEIDLDNVVSIIRCSGVRCVGLQIPEGLKRSAMDISSLLSSLSGASVIVSGDPCYGACDIDLSLAKEVDLLLHVGHAEMCSEMSDRILYIEARMPHEVTDVVRLAARKLKAVRVGITTTVQHVHRLDQAILALRDCGIDGLVAGPSGRTKYPGQILGCSYAAARDLDVEEHLFIGTGMFHPLGIAISTGKRVIAADPVICEVKEVNPEPLLCRRFAAIARASESKRIAVLVSKKPGQMRMELACRMARLGREAGREMMLVYLDNIEPDRMINLGVEAAVSTACPRVALDDASKYKIPVLTSPEFEIALGKRSWEDYRFDEIE